MSAGTPRRVLLCLALCFALAAASGIWLAWSAWHALSIGEVLVQRRAQPPFIAYAVGASSSTFRFEVGIRIVIGSVLGLLGVGGPLLILFAPEARRAKALLAAEQAFRRGSAPTWRRIIIVLSVALVLTLYVAAQST